MMTNKSSQLTIQRGGWFCLARRAAQPSHACVCTRIFKPACVGLISADNDPLLPPPPSLLRRSALPLHLQSCHPPSPSDTPHRRAADYTSHFIDGASRNLRTSLGLAPPVHIPTHREHHRPHRPRRHQWAHSRATSHLVCTSVDPSSSAVVPRQVTRPFQYTLLQTYCSYRPRLSQSSRKSAKMLFTWLCQRWS